MAKFFIPVILDGYLDHYVVEADDYNCAVEKAKEDPRISYIRNPFTNETYKRSKGKWEYQIPKVQLRH